MAEDSVLNLFVSSPGDVQNERERVDFVVERLNAEYKGRAQIRTIRWETRYYSSHETFQAQIPEAAACDLVIAIFGARLGSPLPATFPPMTSGDPYPSGSAYEVLSAIEARRKGQGIPDIFVFRRPRAPLVALDAADRDEVEAQWRRLTGFFETWFRNRDGQFLAAFQEFATTDEFSVKVEDCLRQWLARRGFPEKNAVWDRSKLGSPFPGLAALDESRQSVFFGRSIVIDQAIRRLRDVDAPIERTDKAPFLLLIGASGSGKSSLLNAGVIPRVGLPGLLPEVDLWRRAVMSPGLDPFLSLAESLLQQGALGAELARGPFRTPEILAMQLAGDPETAVAPLRQALETAAEARRREAGFEGLRPARLFLAIDQAERLMLETPAEVQQRFARLIATMCRQRIATVLVALRSDAYARFQALEAFVALRDAGATLDLLPATASELEEMATRPAAQCDPPLAFESREGRSLASTLVADAQGGDALPLLQMTLARLAAAEAARGDGVLRFSDYSGLAAAVTETANEALAGLDGKARADLPQMIAGLVRDVATDPLTGKAAPRIGALDRARFEAGRPERAALVDAFVAKRLLTSEGDAASRRVRPTHESLLRIWPEAVRIIEESAHLIRTREALAPIVRDWAEAAPPDKARHLEISPALLDAATAYVERFGDEASTATRDFVAAAATVAEARRERERQEQERRIADAQAIAAANKRTARRTGVGLVAALVLAALAGWQWRSADEARREAQAQRGRAENALAAATKTADTLVFDLAAKFRSVAGVPKSVVKDILDQARSLQEQLLGSGESGVKLNANHAAALGELAMTELSLGDLPQAMTLAKEARDIYATILAAAPDDMRYIHDVAYTDDLIGDILLQKGDHEAAATAYERARAAADAAIRRGVKGEALRSDLALSLQDLGLLARTRGDTAEALKWFREGLTIAEAMAKAAPDDVAARHGLATARRNVGDALLELKDIEGATVEFDAASAVARHLAQENPNDTLLQRDYTLSQERLGETLTAKKDHAGALKAFSEGEQTAIAMAVGDPGNLEWQYDIAIGHVEVGDAQVAVGDAAAAIASFRAALAIDRALARRDDSNALWRKHLYLSLTRLGDALYRRDDLKPALELYREALAVARTGVAREPSNPDWPQRVANAQGRIGDGLLTTGDEPGALAAYRDALELARTLAPSTEARDTVASDLTRLAGALSLRGDAGSALEAYREAETLIRKAIADDPEPAGRRGQLATLLIGASHMMTRARRSDEAVAALREAADIARSLAAADGAQPLWRREEATALDRLGGALSDKGDAAGALDAYRRSLSIAESLPPEVQAEPTMRLATALTQEALGALLESRKDAPGALAAMRAALALRATLADAAPDDADPRRSQLVDMNAVGRLLNVAGDARSALATFRDGLAIARTLAARPGADAKANSDLAISLFLVGSTLKLTGDPPGAAAAFSEGLPIARALAADGAPNRAYLREVWLLAVNLGDAHLAMNDFSDLGDAYVKGRDAAAAMLRLDAEDAEATGLLQSAVTKIGLFANSMLLAKDFAGAMAILDFATPAAPDQNWLDLVRAACLMFLGKDEEARALYAKHRGEVTYGGKTWEQATTEGFANLRAKGLTNPLMDAIEAEFAKSPR